MAHIVLGVLFYIMVGSVYAKTVNSFVFIHMSRHMSNLEFLRYVVTWPLEFMSDVFMAILCARK